MLQQREISKLLAQAVAHAGSSEHAPDAVLFVSLLSARGLPLITVGSPDAESCISPDALRMYSLMTTNLFKQQPKTGDASLDNWAVLDVDTSLRAVIRKFATTSSGANEHPTTFYTVLFYSSAYADTQAKVRLDSVTAALTAGLSGYRSS